MTTPAAGSHTCSNCFAEFSWTPFAQNGEDFCCSGCADGGPCICTYEGAPHVTGAVASADVPAPPAGHEDHEHTDGTDGAPQESPAVAGESGPPEPPGQPPAPGEAPGDEEPPTNGRLAVIMSAISEMPLPVQEVVRARLSTEGTEEEIGAPFGLTADEVRQLLTQGQAILDRALGPGFRIRYIGEVPVAADEPPAPEFPSFDDVEPTPPPERHESAERPTDLGQMIARSVDALTSAAGSDEPEVAAARDLISEALREAGNLFRLASERLGDEEPSGLPLRAELAGARDEEEPVTLVVENAGDIAPFFMALQSAGAVQWARLEQATPGRAEFRLVIDSMMGLVRDLMAMEGELRPSRLQLSGDEITVELPARRAAQAQAAPVEVPSQRFEIAVDSFFGARHFVESGITQTAPHHHSYRVEASFVTSQPNRYGFVVGFAQIREMVDTTVMDYSETLLNTEEPFLDIPPTTENLARVFHQKIAVKLQDLDQPEVRLKHVRVWESPTNSATYTDYGSNAAATA